jgi:hypothetical protein
MTRIAFTTATGERVSFTRPKKSKRKTKGTRKGVTPAHLRPYLFTKGSAKTKAAQRKAKAAVRHKAGGKRGVRRAVKRTMAREASKRTVRRVSRASRRPAAGHLSSRASAALRKYWASQMGINRFAGGRILLDKFKVGRFPKKKYAGIKRSGKRGTVRLSGLELLNDMTSERRVSFTNPKRRKSKRNAPLSASQRAALKAILKAHVNPRRRKTKSRRK